MSTVADKQTMDFQAEARQLLDLMIHSLYSNKEIFLRELVSNASDACDTLRFEALGKPDLYGDDPDFRIRITFDPEKHTITVSDNGIGMSQEDAVAHLGTIAKSGTQEFFKSLTGDQAKDTRLIGQFGVGFYSSFIVADKVTVISRKAGDAADQGVLWESDGKGTYSVETVTRPTRGTDVTLHLKKDEKEFLDPYRLRHIIHTYADHIAFPVEMQSEEKDKKDEWETVNRASALWQRQKSEIKDEEYKEFYKHVAHDFEEPLTWLHNRVEGKQSYTSLLYIPGRAPFDLWDRDHQHGLKLYVKRVFIMDDAKHLMPAYLRFVRGLVDSDDLPLNVSRELLQQNKLINSIRSASVKRILNALAKMADKEPEKYATVWMQFGKVIKEGPGEDTVNRDRILKLLRFSSTNSDEQTVSLADYLGRMKKDQKYIYYLTADSLNAAKNSSHLGLFRGKDIEVLLLYDRVDEWMMSHIEEYQDKKFKSIAKGELDLDDLIDEDEQKAREKLASQHTGLVERIKTALNEKIRDVRVSHRLTDAPSCIVLEDHDMSMHLQRMFKSAGHEVPLGKPVLEINIEHPLVLRMEEEADEDRFVDWSQLLLDQAILSEGGELDDPADYVKRLNSLLVDLSGAESGGRIIVD